MTGEPGSVAHRILGSTDRDDLMSAARFSPGRDDDLEDLMPSVICVFCDRCGDEDRCSYVVRESDAPDVRYGYARAKLRAAGWSCTPGRDLCPACLTTPGVTP